MGGIREFATGASRDTDAGKLDLEGFLSPLVLERYGQYMHEHRKLPDGSYRDADNWQKGIPHAAYMKSGWRHFFDWWKEHRGIATGDGIENALCALIFNASGYLHERIKARQPEVISHARAAEILRDMTIARIEADDDTEAHA